MKALSIGAALLLALAYAGPVFAKTLSVAVFDYPPVSILGDDERPGYCFEVVEKIYTDLGYTVEKHELPLPRAMRAVESGAVDLICTINPHNNKNLILAASPNVSIQFHFWKRADDPFYFRGIESLKDATVINIAGFNYTSVSDRYQAFLTAGHPGIYEIAGEAPLSGAFKMLNRGNADVFCLDYDTARYILQDLGLADRIVPAGGFETRFLAYPAVGPDHPRGAEILAEFEQGYRKLRQSGRVAHIMSKYVRNPDMELALSD